MIVLSEVHILLDFYLITLHSITITLSHTSYLCSCYEGDQKEKTFTVQSLKQKSNMCQMFIASNSISGIKSNQSQRCPD